MASMPARFDDLFNHKAQKREFRQYIAGLLGESERKNLTQMANNALDVTYHKIHNFLTRCPLVLQTGKRETLRDDGEM